MVKTLGHEERTADTLTRFRVPPCKFRGRSYNVKIFGSRTMLYVKAKVMEKDVIEDRCAVCINA